MNFWGRVGCLSMATSIALGAFGAHGLKSKGFFDNPYFKEIWDTATMYHFIHSIGMVVVSSRPYNVKQLKLINGAFLGGIVLFSGSLYAYTLTQKKWLGAITPLGGKIITKFF